MHNKLSNVMSEQADKTEVFCDTDETLVRAFQTGNNNAFDRLVLKHKERVFQMCYRFLSDYDEANDSAQEVFVKVYSSLKKFRGQSRFSTWLYRITVNTCKNKLTSRRYRLKSSTVSLNDVTELDTGTNSSSPIKNLETKQKELLIQGAINTLPVGQKIVIVLRHIEGLSYEQIAEATGFAIGTVKSKLARARFRLREKLEEVL
ncbi:MAG: RNA polymerase sigma factor [bacterium]